MNNELVSIILPVYKADRLTENCIKSVLLQDYENMELLIIENGAFKSDLEERIKEFTNSDKIRYFNEKMANVSKARNIGLKNATGKYIAFIDDDDIYEKDFIFKMVLNIEENEIITSGYKRTNSNKKTGINNSSKLINTTNLQEYIEELKSNDLFNPIWNKLYLKSIIDDNNISFNEKCEIGEDFIFNIDYMRFVNSATYIDECLYFYNDENIGLNLKYREDRFEIDHNLINYMEIFFDEKNYSKEFIYNCYAENYWNGITSIYSPRNTCSEKEKNETLRKFMKSSERESDLRFLKGKVKNNKFKIIITLLQCKRYIIIKILIKSRILRHKIKKLPI